MARVALRRDPTRDGSGPHARAAVWLFLAFSILYIGITRGHFISIDEVDVYQAARMLWEEGNLSVYTTNTDQRVPGRHGMYYSRFGVGQSIAAVPLYALGKLVGRTLDELGKPDWVQTFAGPMIERSDLIRWGGDVDIFFVNLLNCFTTALLCAVFFAFSLRLGAAPRWSLGSTLLLGLTSYVAPFSTGFFQHSTEALCVLWCFYLLFCDAQRSDWRLRAWAGGLLALALQFRLQSAVAIPGLGLYVLWSVWRRRPTASAILRYLPAAAWEIFPFAAAVAAGFGMYATTQYVRFATVYPVGGYDTVHFDTPLLKGLYAYLLSPGDSILLFTPLLVLCPWTCRLSMRRHAAETFIILLLAASYLVLYGTFKRWHGLWCFGPRFLSALVPLLLLPLGCWMEQVGRKAWLVVAPLAIAGFWMQLIHVAVNFWSVALNEGYLDFQPPEGFLFIPDSAPLVAHSRALLAGDWRVDMWLVNVYHMFGLDRVLAIAVPLFGLLVVCLWKLRQSVRALDAGPASPGGIRFGYPRQRVGMALGLVAATMAFGFVADHREWIPHTFAARGERADGDADAELMNAGLDALYGRHDPSAAISQFRAVLAHNPTHYGATYQLAAALDAEGKASEARPWWVKALALAELIHDEPTAEAARARLQRQP